MSTSRVMCNSDLAVAFFDFSLLVFVVQYITNINNPRPMELTDLKLPDLVVEIQFLSYRQTGKCVFPV